MGKDKSTGTTVVNQQTTPEPTEAEKRMQELQVQQFEQTVGPQTEAQLAGLNLVQTLLQGEVPGGIFQNLGGGISPEAIGTQATNYTKAALPTFQGAGLLDSGVMAKSIAKGIASDIMFPAEQFNIGAMQNLMNLALTGQAQVQQPITAGQSILSNQLAGLRSVNTSGYQNTTQKSMNPFLRSFQTSVGSGTFGNTGGWFSG